jgi:hypothetical protein
LLNPTPRPAQGREDHTHPTEDSCWADFARILGRLAFQQYRADLREPAIRTTLGAAA